MSRVAASYLRLGILLTILGPLVIVFLPEWMGPWLMRQTDPDLGYWTINVVSTMMRWSVTPLGVGLILVAVLLKELGPQSPTSVPLSSDPAAPAPTPADPAAPAREGSV